MPSRRALERQTRHLAILQSGENLEVGDAAALPLPLSDLKEIEPHSPCVMQYFSGGLTAEVFHLEVDGQHFALKRKRERIRVKNADGQTSFLNEVLRRRDFEALKQRDPVSYSGIVDTVYASLAEGIILSLWIPGFEIECYTPDMFDGIFFTLMQMERGGVFECDPTHANLLWQEGVGVRFYDFGYAYPFDARCEFNSDGTELPILHAAERFETRCFMPHLLDIEELVGLERCLSLYRAEKEAAIKHYEAKLAWLGEVGGTEEVKAHVSRFVALWREGLDSDEALLRLYWLESFRSCLIDVLDDLSGKSCNPDTLDKAQHVIDAVESSYAFLLENKGFFLGDETRSRKALILQYRGYLDEARENQLKDLSEFNAWRKRQRARVVKLYA